MKKFTFCFRVDSNEKIGIGHIKRCVRIAQKLRENGHQSIFFTDRKSNLDFFIKNFKIFYLYDKNSKFISQKNDAKKFLKKIENNNIIVVLDDYRLDFNWEQEVSKNKIKVIVLDDSQTKKHFCDIYINYKPSLVDQTKIKSNIFKKKDTQLLLGPKYAIIDCKQNDQVKRPTKNVYKICFYMGGGGDFKFFNNIILRFINLSAQFKKKFELNIVRGIANKNFEKMILLSKKYKFIKIIDGRKNLDKKISSMDLLVGSAGNIVYETSYYNIPSIFFEISKNQNNDLQSMENIGHYFVLNKLDLKKYIKIANLIYLILINYKRVFKLVKNKRVSIDNNGLDRIVKNIFFNKKTKNHRDNIFLNKKKEYFISKRVKDNEINDYLDSRNLMINRKVSFSQKKISRLDHYIWWFNTKRVSYSIIINKKKIMYLYDETFKINSKNYSLQGWFSTQNKFGIKEVLLALNWHKEYMSKKKNIDLSFGVIKKDNVINFSKYLGWIPINENSNEFQILKKINQINKEYNYYTRN